uniref:TLDc domain-containing protein n=1 Tax=Skeletonema marinoi TaxID=267567 RepID=A0A7S2PDG0_9STRA|mmetsp:Transcript_19554/g.33079  ORF Transcript_19554/g.33079 Transcript_19554/m.33079 type:complete len:320 (+) Transcript_19554:114-1073(+)
MTTMLADEWGEWEMGDFGFYQDLDDDDHHGVDSSLTLSSSSSNLFNAPPTPATTTASCSPHRTIEDPQPSTLTTSPPILSPTIIDTLAEDGGLPWSMQDMNWVRLFNSERDGTSFGQFMRSVRNVEHTVIVAKTESGMIVGGYVADVWSGRKSRAEEERGHNAFLFVVQPPAAPAMTDDDNKEVSPSQQQQQFRVKRFIPGLEDIASSPTGVLEFNFDTLSLHSSSDKIDHNKEQVVHIFKPSPRQASLKQVCQLGNKLISLGDDDTDLLHDDHHMKNFMTIENSFSKGQVTMTSSDGGCITEEFDVVNFEVYCLSDDD